MSRQIPNANGHTSGPIPVGKGPNPAKREKIGDIPVLSSTEFDPRYNLGYLVAQDPSQLEPEKLMKALFQEVFEDAKLLKQVNTRQKMAYTRHPDEHLTYSHQVITMDPRPGHQMSIISFAISDFNVPDRHAAEQNSVAISAPSEVKGYYTRVVVAHNATELNSQGRQFEVLFKLNTTDFTIMKEIHDFLIANADKLNTRDGRRSLMRALNRTYRDRFEDEHDIVASVERE